MPVPLRFCFDFISPYAYLAWTQIHALAARHGRDVEPWPVLFAALLDNAGSLGPAEIPLKRTYVFKDTLRSARLLGIPLVPPPTHPFNPLLALRVATVPIAPVERRPLIDALFAAAWGGGGGVEDPDQVRAIAGAALVARAAEPATKLALRAQTDAAIAAGAFGVPTILVDGELFWGFDSLPHVERFLVTGERVTDDDLARWNHIRPSAQRELKAPRADPRSGPPR